MKSKFASFLVLILALALSACSTQGTTAASPLESDLAETTFSVKPTLADTTSISAESETEDTGLTHESD